MFRLHRLREVEKLKRLRLSQLQRDLVDKRYTDIIARAGFLRKSARPFARYSNFNIHDKCLFMFTDVGKFCYMDVLPPDVYAMFCDVSDATRAYATYDVVKADLPAMWTALVEALCSYERLMPTTEHAMIVRLWLSIADAVATWGPAFCHWLFSMERYMSYCIRQVKDRSRPEQSFMNRHTFNLAINSFMQSRKADLLQQYGAGTTAAADHLIRDYVNDGSEATTRLADAWPARLSQKRDGVQLLTLVDDARREVYQLLRMNGLPAGGTPFDVVASYRSIHAGVITGGSKRGTSERGARRSVCWGPGEATVLKVQEFMQLQCDVHGDPASPFKTYRVVKVQSFEVRRNRTVRIPFIDSFKPFPTYVKVKDIGGLVAVGIKPDKGGRFEFIIDTERYHAF